ncbi:hypothetical protein [Paenibacillus senegalimassiliensis]|uniref:hypothetical protein n=1 Tax=Paenibacillus senegalimassiliensis TaxID=1737426 RepID=UPI00073E62DD|nr:hypothetical protein [Paenibacillus senegalimassiliensis]
MKKKISGLLIALILICVSILAINLYHGLISNKTYDLQLGHNPNQELPKMDDDGVSFKNDTRLIAMAIYPDKKEQILQAQLYVTKRGESRVLQVEKMRETADLAAFEMRLRNLSWEPGEYTIYFKRGTEIQLSLDFTLK